MPIFGEYARYYDIFYRDKDYESEVATIDALIRRHCALSALDGTHILDLGCGTGAHAEYLARRGYSVTGVDMSTDMLECATLRMRHLPPELVDRLAFIQGDTRSVRLGRRFSAAVSLFHVMSYQTENADLAATLDTARIHLHPNGVFIFDFWYGPAVLSEHPEVRTKRWDDQSLTVVRITKPDLDVRRNLVKIHFEVSIEDKIHRTRRLMSETHTMRYLFEPELDLLLAAAGFQRLEIYDWDSGLAPNIHTWNVYCVSQRI